MNKITIEIDTSNSAFDGDMEGEVCRILLALACAVHADGLDDRKVFDLNGNTIGRVRCDEPPRLHTRF
jgi:hypothetical protein